MATIPEIWIPAFIFGNLWALFWIMSMMYTYTPGFRDCMISLFCCKKKKKKEEEDEKHTEQPVEFTSSAQPTGVGRKDTEWELRKIEEDFKELRRQDPEPQTTPQIPQHPPSMGRTHNASARGGNALRMSPPSGAPHEAHDTQSILRRVTRVDTLIVDARDLEWRNIGCKYVSGSAQKIVLEGVFGRVKPREMMALMGPSGAGKSTLLDILTMRKTLGELSGEVMVDGKEREGGFLRMSSYVPQEDNFIPTMTTLETLNFYARLVLPGNTSAKERKRCVDEVLYMVGLDGQKDTMVGGLLPGGIHLRGLSGGERRRLSIAAGVVSAPSIIFLDEPTSGLDSFAALNVMQYMKSLAKCKLHTVIASIHQPRTSIWNMFDKVTILSKGKMMYSGETSNVVPWFTQKLGYSYDNNIHGVVSDWVIDLVSIGFTKPDEFYGNTMRTEAQLEEASNTFYTEYKALRKADARKEGTSVPESDEYDEEEAPARVLSPVVVRKRTTHFVVEPAHTDNDNTSSTSLKKRKRSMVPIFWQGYPTSWFNQLMALTWRSVLNVTRNPADVAGRMLNFTYVGAFIGLVFYNLPQDLPSLQTRLNIIFNTASFFMFIPYTSMSLFTADRQFYKADVTAKLYDSSAYYLANVISNFPFAILNAIVYALLVYGMAGMNPDIGAIWRSVLLSVIESLISLQVLHFAAVATHNQDTAFMVAISFTAVNVVVSNFFLPFYRIRLSWIRWLQYISAMGYTFNAGARLEFQDQNFTCSSGPDALGLGDDLGDQLRRAFPNSGSSINVALGFLGSQSATEDCVFSGNSILEYYDTTISYGSTLGVLILYLTVLHIMTYLALIFLAKKDKR